MCGNAPNVHLSIIEQGTDVTMLAKLNKQHSKNKLYIGGASARNTTFGIKHFAGTVYYETTGTFMRLYSIVKYTTCTYWAFTQRFCPSFFNTECKECIALTKCTLKLHCAEQLMRICGKNMKTNFCTVEPLYNEVLGTMKITLLYQVSHYIRVKKTKKYKELGPAKLPRYKKILLYPTSL